jgi:tetratricopeptide (TPR) repeat protein
MTLLFNRTTFLKAAVITLAVGVIYFPVLHGDWLWDDDQLVTNNPVIQDPAGWSKIWLTPGSLIDYQPIKASVVWLQWQLWGRDTLGYHLTNILLHLISALLVWRLLGKFGLKRAWLGGLLFAIHPVMVESVAWISELKNTLSLPPFLLAMGAWIDYQEQGKRRDYFLALGLFIAAMLCKATMVMFPFVILLHAWWKRGRIGGNDLKASAPFFAVSLVMGMITIWFMNQAIGDAHVTLGGPGFRVACAGQVLCFYFFKSVLPLDPMPVYPRWPVDPPSLAQFLPWPVLGASLVWLWTKRTGWGRHALLGFGFFFINLIPFLGLNAAPYMYFTWAMDHVLYLPIFGIIGLLVAGWDRAQARLAAPLHPYALATATLLALLLAVESRAYAAKFVDAETLWRYEVQHNPGSWVGHNGLGCALFQKKQYLAALPEFQETLQMTPDFSAPHYNLGQTLFRLGHYEEAIAQYQEALRIYPTHPNAHNDLGVAYDHLNRWPEAVAQYQMELQIDPKNSRAHLNLGVAYATLKRWPEAVQEDEAALRLDPNNAEADNDLAIALVHLNRWAEARAEFEVALKLNPGDAKTQANLIELQRLEQAAAKH